MNTIIKHAAKNKNRTWFHLLCQITLLAIVLLTAFGFVQPAYAANLNVNTTADELNNDGDCSLREAIQAANTNAAVDACVAGSGADIIFLPSGTYTININGTSEDANVTGDFDVTAAETLVIIGSGSSTTIIDGGFGDRVLHLTNAGGTLQLVSLTVQSGLTFDEPGGGVLSWGTLVLNHVNVQQNGVLGSSSSAIGGGLCVGCGTGTGYLTMYDSVIRNNSAKIAGGIFTNVIALIDRSSIISNTATLNPGGIANYGVLTIYNSLVSDNTANALGSSGIFNQGTLTLADSTISHNQADPGFTGIANIGTTITSNTIIANNTPANCANTSSFSSQGYNLSSDNSCLAFLNSTSDINNTDPMLGTLQTNGVIYFRPLLAGSPAIDTGNNASCPTTDQRGIARPQGGGCDIGAFEYVIPFEKLAPVDAGVGVSLSPTLSWQPSSGATSYEYCYSSAPGPCTKWNSVGTNTSVTLSGLAPNYTYYWQVRAVTGSDTVEANTGTWWLFTTTTTAACTWPAYTPPASATFGDVPITASHWNWVERLANSTITAGCGAGNYCPFNEVNRAQMAIFLLRGKHCGSSYTPPAVGATTGFGDVPLDTTYAPWVKQLAVEGITAGCGGGNFCPLTVVNRAQMATFLLRTKHGANYSPPAVGASTGFGDVPLSATYAPWVKQLAAEGITSGCGSGNYCPLQNVNRAQMATFLVRAFGLP